MAAADDTGGWRAALSAVWIPALVSRALVWVAGVVAMRRLDLTYAAYAIVTLIVLLCEPVIHGNPLTSLPRYILVLFPLWIWLAAWATERPRAKFALPAVSALLLAGFTAQFATWRFVA